MQRNASPALCTSRLSDGRQSFAVAGPIVRVIAIVTILAVGATPVLADSASPGIFESPQQLVEALMLALNTKDASLLDKIYLVLNLNLCNSFELLVANAVLRTDAYSPLLLFENLKESKAVLTVPLRVEEMTSGFGSATVDFRFRWSYVAKTDKEESSEEINLAVTWETGLFDEGWRVMAQRTSPCEPR